MFEKMQNYDSSKDPSLNLNCKIKSPANQQIVWCAGLQSYYGGLLCVAWSHDGRYIATGGEDDLISIYGVLERSVVMWGQGHTSWVAAVAFDSE